MRVAALYDVHGNLPALEAVLADVASAGVVEIVVGGDVLWGPLQVECVATLRSAGARFLAGNCERDVLQPTGEVDHWCSRRLSGETRSFVETWPQTIEEVIQGLNRVVFCHATPRDVDEILTTLTPDDDVRGSLVDVEADVVVCGHTHVQFDRTVDDTRVVNAGSVGFPHEAEPAARARLLRRLRRNGCAACRARAPQPGRAPNRDLCRALRDLG
jgi:predicted phosphodiesterase